MVLGKSGAVLCAFMAAVFYAISSPVSKVLLEDVSPYLMAALLYLGTGIGMTAVRSVTGAGRREEPYGRKDLPHVVAMVVLDIAAPILLMYGLLSSPASSVSLLNNFEIVATTVIAVTLFGERVSARMWLAVAVITLSVILLSLDGVTGLSFNHGSLAVVAACVCWGLENNCTGRLSSTGPSRVVEPGDTVLGMSLAEGGHLSHGSPVNIAGKYYNFVSYGLSLYLYISAQVALGASRVSAYYASAPFIGAVLSFAILGESLSGTYLVALVVMAAGAAIMTWDTLRPDSGDPDSPGPGEGALRRPVRVRRRTS